MIIDTIKNRRTVRFFLKKKVEREKIYQLIEAAQWAPSACNKQLWEFIIVESDVIKNELVSKAGAVSFLKSAPLVIYVIYPEKVTSENHANIQSASASIQNLLLQAYELDLGTAWINQCGDRAEVQKILNVPDSFVIVAAILVGYPDTEREPPPPKRRKIDELIHFNVYEKKPDKIGHQDWLTWDNAILQDYRSNGIRATSPFEVTLSNTVEIQKEIDLVGKFMNKDASVLDILSFDGTYPLEIIKRKYLNEIYVYETSEEIREFILKRKENSMFNGKINFLLGDLYSIPVEDESFGVVTCFQKINRAPDSRILFREMIRVLKKEGLLFLSFLQYNSLYGINSYIRQKFKNEIFINNEGPLMPLKMSFIRKMCYENKLNIVSDFGIKLLPRKLFGEQLRLTGYVSDSFLRYFCFIRFLVIKKQGKMNAED